MHEVENLWMCINSDWLNWVKLVNVLMAISSIGKTLLSNSMKRSKLCIKFKIVQSKNYI